MTRKPCFFCGQSAEVTFDPETVFDLWAEENQIISPCRSRFDDVREKLEWAARDETEYGCHRLCALKWAIETEGFSVRYPLIPEEVKEEGL